MKLEALFKMLDLFWTCPLWTREWYKNWQFILFCCYLFLKTHTRVILDYTTIIFIRHSLSLTSNEGKKKWSSCRVNSRKNFNWAPTLSTIETHTAFIFKVQTLESLELARQILKYVLSLFHAFTKKYHSKICIGYVSKSAEVRALVQ